MPNQEATPYRLLNTDIFSVTVAQDWSVSFHVSIWPVLIVLGIALVLLVVRRYGSFRHIADFEIDGAEVGIGDHKISFKPNDTDRQIAYSIWVELSTRKIGLEIDRETDVVNEVYDSWYAFFGITRDLIKSLPVSKVRQDGTRKIIDLSIDVLNVGIRPHLDRWQAKFRRWYEAEEKTHPDKSPQEIQALYPEYEALMNDLVSVNKKLMIYREKMDDLFIGV